MLHSAFTVVEVQWSDNLMKPHSIQLQAAMDNKTVELDLPLAPWY